jgi:hypothetical protein
MGMCGFEDSCDSRFPETNKAVAVDLAATSDGKEN